MLIVLALLVALLLIGYVLLFLSFRSFRKHVKEYLYKVCELEERIKEVQYDLMELEKIVKEMWNKV